METFTKNMKERLWARLFSQYFQMFLWLTSKSIGYKLAHQLVSFISTRDNDDDDDDDDDVFVSATSAAQSSFFLLGLLWISINLPHGLR